MAHHSIVDDPLAWLLIPNEELQRMEKEENDRINEAKYGPRCPRCHYRVNHPSVNYPHLPWCKPGEHDCYTGDEMAR